MQVGALQEKCGQRIKKGEMPMKIGGLFAGFASMGWIAERLLGRMSRQTS
jgi:hypothetical protein